MPDFEDIPGLAELWRCTRGDPRTRVALIDGPCDVEHECFSGAAIEVVPTPVLPGLEPEEKLLDHPTSIASLLVGQPGSPVEGIAPRIHLLAVEGARREEDVITELGLVTAIDLALAESPDIVHCAYCLPSQSSTVSDLLSRALEKVAAAGALLVAPVGNNRGECYCAPADQSGVLAVGGLNDDGTVRESSNHGPHYATHGVMAWAENLLGALPGGGAKRRSGTSGAAAVVTGVAALLVSALRERGGNVVPRAVGALIRETARLLDETERARAVGGVLDPAAALRALLGDDRRHDGGPGIEPSLRLPSRLFALGQLTADLPDEKARERLAARMQARESDGRLDLARPEDVRALHAHLRDRPEDATLITWVLTIGEAPHYVLEPTGAHALDVNHRLIAVLGAGAAAPEDQPSSERMSVPGIVTARRRALRTGQRVPVVAVARPDGISAWRTADLAAVAQPPDADESVRDATADLLARIYHHHRNDGTLAPDRALNFAGTNAVQAAAAVQQALARGLRLQRLAVDKSRFDRPRSECWDVQAQFYDPEQPDRGSDVWVWSIDVAEPLPVSVGVPRRWSTVNS
jgi:thiazoline dehydrogenase / protease